MSGHSKWATIKRQKAINDKFRGKVFSKLTKAITIAVKTGGGPDVSSNYKLRVAVEAARAENMPKDTIERAINKGSGGEALEEITYEGFGPGGVGFLVQVATDNRNRTAQEIKSTFERVGGSLGGPGSVSFNFEPKGYLVIERSGDIDAQMLALIDLGVEEVEEGSEAVEVYTNAHELFNVKGKVEELGFRVLRAELMQKPTTVVPINEKEQEKLLGLIESLESLEDVQRVFDNASLN